MRLDFDAPVLVSVKHNCRLLVFQTTYGSAVIWRNVFYAGDPERCDIREIDPELVKELAL
jgi:hypothetical protein